MSKLIEIYDVTNDITCLLQQLRKLNNTIRRSDVALLLREYIIEEIYKYSNHVANYTPFSNLAYNLFEYQEVINTVSNLYHDRLLDLYNIIIRELKIDNNSFVMLEIKTNGAMVDLEVQNEGDYRIVEYELRKEGYL